MAAIWPLLKQQTASQILGSAKMGRIPNSKMPFQQAMEWPACHQIQKSIGCQWKSGVHGDHDQIIQQDQHLKTWRFPRFQMVNWAQLRLKLRCIKDQLSGWKWHAVRDGNCSCLYAEQWHSSDVSMILERRATGYVGYLWITVSQITITGFWNIVYVLKGKKSNQILRMRVCIQGKAEVEITTTPFSGPTLVQPS